MAPRMSKRQFTNIVRNAGSKASDGTKAALRQRLYRQKRTPEASLSVRELLAHCTGAGIMVRREERKKRILLRKLRLSWQNLRQREGR